MHDLPIKIVPMTRTHVAACDDIVRTSEPWDTLRESIDFRPAIRGKSAYVAVVGGAVAGFVIFTPEPIFARGGYLRAIGVASAVRGFGIGRALLAFAERRTARKAPNLYLCASSFNRDAQRFYRRLGYRKVGRIDDLVRRGKAEIIYRKRLGK